MNLGAGLSGLSATYPGYMSAEEQASKTELNQQTAKEGALKLLGAHVLGLALAGGAPDQGPQAPPPGQASVPSGPPPQQFSGPSPQGGPPMPAAPQPPPAPQQPLSPVAGGVPEGAGPPEISLPALTNRILQTSPGIRNHPEVLLAALERAAPMLDRQGKEDLAEAKNKFTEQRLELAKDALREAQRNHDMQNQGRTRAADQRDIREARLATGAQVRQDQAYQRLFVQQQALQAKVAQTNNANDIKKLHEITQAMHNRATDILKANNQFTTLSDEDKASLKAEQDKFYEDQKARIEKVTGVPPPDFGSRFDAAKPSGVPSSQPAAAAAAPPPVAIPPQILQDAQSAIAKGAPRAAVIKRLQEQGYPTDGL